MASEPLIVQAVYSYKRTNNDELNFKKGDIITVTQKDEGWWEGTLNGQTGWFPSNYVKECKDAPKPIINQQNEYKGVVLKDLIDSEKAHVTELEGLVTNFLQPLEKSSILTPDEYKQLTGNITEILEIHQQLLSLIEAESNKPGIDQRVGKLFLTWAPRIKNVHQAYCSLHPRAVCVLDKYRDELTKYMESKGAASPGVLVLTTMLSKPFRRLDKYSGMLQELERHVEECHPDRGDTQRSVSIYKDIAATCSATRRQKELELQVLTGPVRGWEGPSLNTLGDIIYMGSVAVGPQHHDRYFVLFPTALVILSVSHRLSAFIYEGKLFLSGLSVMRLEDNDQYKNAFEISAPMIDKRVAVCQSKEEADHWVELLRKQTCRSSTVSNASQKVTPSQAQLVPQPPPHCCSLNRRGYCNRTSVLSYQSSFVYTPLHPPENYPSASPYAALTRYYYKLIKAKVITRKLLRQLLYSEHLNKFNLSLVKIRHYKTETSIFIKGIHCRDSIINCDSDSDSDSSESDGSFKFKRQDAMKLVSDDCSSSSSNPFGYVWYYNPKTGSERQETLYECFEDKPENSSIKPVKQISEESQASSNIPEPKAYMACEDLHSLEDTLDLKIVPQGYVPTVRQSCPTKLVGNKFNESSLTTIYIPPWSNSENNISHKKNLKPQTGTESHSTSLEIPANTMPLPDKVIGELLYNIDGEFTKSQSIDSSETVIKPPTLFAKDVEVVPEKISLNLENVKFRKHSIDSDKPKRRSSIHSPQDKRLSRYMDMDKPTTSRQSFCRCCMEYCHSPRSSDSGMAGSCTLNSPDLGNPGEINQERCSMDVSNLLRQYNAISLSEIEARNFELECPCTSPFGSTPRTSEQECIPGYVLTRSRDSLRTSAPSRISESKRHSKMFHSEMGVQKSHSAGCLLEEGGKEDVVEKEEAEGKNDGTPMVYKSELYAHWWLKAKIPSDVVRGIYLDTRSPTTDVSSNSRKRDKSNL